MKLESMTASDKNKATRDVLRQLRYISAKVSSSAGSDFRKDPIHKAINTTYTFFGKHSHEIM